VDGGVDLGDDAPAETRPRAEGGRREEEGFGEHAVHEGEAGAQSAAALLEADPRRLCRRLHAAVHRAAEVRVRFRVRVLGLGF